jgi:tetratricopeptide (TPR) repeat protein
LPATTASTDAGNLANLYAGLCYANLDKWQDAVKYLEAYSPASDAMVSPAAIEALGNAYAHVGQIDKAVSKLKEAASKADKQAKDGVNYSLSPSFLLQAAHSSSRRTSRTGPEDLSGHQAEICQLNTHTER